jgi:hypothetical protein
LKQFAENFIQVFPCAGQILNLRKAIFLNWES